MRTAPHSPPPPTGALTSRRSFLKAGLLASVLAGAQAPFAQSFAATSAPSPFADPIYHFLNRISWSVRSADLIRCRKLGIKAYLEEQLSARVITAGNTIPMPLVLRLPRKTIYSYFKKDPYGVASDGLVYGMIQRAVYSPAQLYERIVEFWSDHFNIAKDDLAPEVVDWQRTVIRPFALGKFRTLLQATARHPAMLYYLDNADSNKDHPNENYGREVMELHTLGAGSGYSESDVKNIARAFTGWTADYTDYGGFVYDPEIHDTGDKVVLGQAVPGRDGTAGFQEGVEVLNILASDPRCARFLCRKLCTRFISDAFAKPGPDEQAVIDALAAVWKSTDGDIRSVLRALFGTTAFANSAGQKLRRPLEFFVAARRATGTVFLQPDEQEYSVELLDQAPYGWGPPNGYPDVAAAWATTSGLLGRWNIAQSVTADALPGEDSDLRTTFHTRLAGVKTWGQLVDRLSFLFFAAVLPEETRQALLTYATGGQGNADTRLTLDLFREKLGPLAGLILSVPQFQWR